ncbi:hypothetical protein J6590_080932 [Homalodisca vitripennis]|nr:hypothetical protein J6590_080932 [Homalodisca vitripennis]
MASGSSAERADHQTAEDDYDNAKVVIGPLFRLHFEMPSTGRQLSVCQQQNLGVKERNTIGFASLEGCESPEQNTPRNPIHTNAFLPDLHLPLVFEKNTLLWFTHGMKNQFLEID